MLYMVTFTINIPPMLAYIPAPWIRHGIYFMIILYSLPESSILIDPISFGSRGEVSTRHSTTRHGPWRPMFFFPNPMVIGASKNALVMLRFTNICKFIEVYSGRYGTFSFFFHFFMRQQESYPLVI